MFVDSGPKPRELRQITLEVDLVVVGGGLSGTCAAITAARAGAKVVLVQDRPVLGGNASSEVRLWALGATSHMGNNNRWAREGGVIDEICVENTYRNPEGNPLLFDALLLEKVTNEPNIDLLLNTAVYEADTHSDGSIKSAGAFCSQNSTIYCLRGKTFCDASGDGVLGFLVGAAFRMGAENKDEFEEGMAPDEGFGHLLGHSLYFYSKDTGQPVNFTAPAFALDDLGEIPRFRKFDANSSGCAFWWIEYGGRLDTVHDTEEIKWELWKVVYGVWNYIKNSGKFPEAENLTLEWVGTIPGKRESRRFEGDYIMRQSDIVEQRTFPDAVSFGGWAIDLHPADGVFSKRNACEQYHSKGVYQIPYRSLYSRNVPNLFLGGRTMSASHVAFGSTRVMQTCAHNGQAIGMAAALCAQNNTTAREVDLVELQQRLIRSGHFVPHLALQEESKFQIQASETATVSELKANADYQALDAPLALLYPAKKGRQPEFTLFLKADEASEVEVQLQKCSRLGSYTPDTLVETSTIRLEAGENTPSINFTAEIDRDQYLFLCLAETAGVKVAMSHDNPSGFTTVHHGQHKAVAKGAVQTPPADSGVDSFGFWIPRRRPEGKNLAIKINPALEPYSVELLQNSYQRPFIQTNAWACNGPADLKVSWEKDHCYRELVLCVDTDFDHPMETVQWGHPERIMPNCAQDFDVLSKSGEVIEKIRGNYQTRVRIALPSVETGLTIRFLNSSTVFKLLLI